MHIKTIPESARQAFSLIEVTIAMAIAAVALVSLMALIPQGMNTMMEAGDEAIMARIHQQVLNELQMADYDAVAKKYNEFEIYFDSQGEEIGSKERNRDAQGSFEHIYTARISVPVDGGKLPDSVGGAKAEGFSFDKGTTTSELLRPVVIEIAAVSGLGAEFKWDDPNYRRMVKTYQSILVKMGQAFKDSSGEKD